MHVVEIDEGDPRFEIADRAERRVGKDGAPEEQVQVRRDPLYLVIAQ